MPRGPGGYTTRTAEALGGFHGVAVLVRLRGGPQLGRGTTACRRCPGNCAGSRTTGTAHGAQAPHSPSAGWRVAGFWPSNPFLFPSLRVTQTLARNPDVYHPRRLSTTNCELSGFPAFAFLLRQRQQLTRTAINPYGCFTTRPASSRFTPCCQLPTNQPHGHVYHRRSAPLTCTPGFDPSGAKCDSRYFHCYL